MRELEPDAQETCELFGKYELTHRIATGGMAEIFKAYSTSIDGFQKVVALKRILPHLSVDAEFVSLFIAEAKLAVRLSHSNIVHVFDFGKVQESYYIALEYIEGRDLTQLLIKQSKRRAFVPTEVALHIISETLRGLEYSHTCPGPDGELLGIVHRDVSPHNILVSYHGEVKITDFGIAKAKTHVSLSKPGIVFGKFAYMSPEQANGLDVDLRSDVYSAGITFYETLTGRRLFFSDDPVKTLAKVRDPRVPPPSKYNTSLGPELDAVVMKALARRPEDRFQSCRDFAGALQTELHRLAPEFTDSHVAHFMKELFEDEVGAAKFPLAEEPPTRNDDPARRSRRSASAVSKVSGSATLGDPVLGALRERLRHEPSLWSLVEAAERLEHLGRRDLAVATYRVAAAKFAQNGLLVQAVALFATIRDLEGWNPTLASLAKDLPRLAGRSNASLLEWLPPFDDLEIRDLLEGMIVSSEPAALASALTSPLFSFLDPAEFANLIALIRLKRLAPGTTLIREGDPGDALYILARGRAIIYCLNFQGNKVYLSSLSDGDCVGEFSFFTGERRAASVETLDEVLLFEIRQQDFDQILEQFPNLTNALLQFYKDRVVGTLLAKSEVFGVLPPRPRERLLERLTLESHPRGSIVLREDEQSDGFYLIKSGEVEVYSERRGYVFLSKLRSGDFFGEIAAITGQRRTASVRALGPCELLRLSGADLQELVQTNPELQRILERRIAEREAETARRITAGGTLV